MLLAITTRWNLTVSALGAGLLRSTLGADHVSFSKDATEVDWSLQIRGHSVELTIGPFDPRQRLHAAFELHTGLSNAVSNELPAEAVRDCYSGPRITFAGMPEDDGLAAAIADEVRRPLARILYGAGLESATVVREGDTIEARLVGQPVPQRFGPAAVAAACLVWTAVLELLINPPEDTLEARPEPIIEAGQPHVQPEDWSRTAPFAKLLLSTQALEQLGRWLGLEMDPHVASAVTPRRPAAAEPDFLPAGNLGELIRFVPFDSGGRPIDELEAPGSGCSEAFGFLRSGQPDLRAEDDDLWILFSLAGTDVGLEAPTVEISAWFLPHEGVEAPPVPVPGLQRREVDPALVAPGDNGVPTTKPAKYRPGEVANYVIEISPQKDLLPSDGPTGWSWQDASEVLRLQSPDGADPYTFSNFFHRRILIEITLLDYGNVVGRSQGHVQIYDLDRFGSLYGRLLDLVTDDTRRQAEDLGEPGIYAAHHPWYPVLGIGMNKANFYMHAVVEDATLQTRHLQNPWWLLDVGLYLEYLTCIGVFEMVRDEYPDLLSAAELESLHEGPQFTEIRDRIKPSRWKEVWDLKEISPRGRSPVAAGPVGFLNLIGKQKATLEFLRAHHEDLVHAVDLAGPDLNFSQEAWHRVYRDAERAVTNSSLAAFPELRHVPAAYREFILWHNKGDFKAVPGGFLLPRAITKTLGDQDGLYPSAARQYRLSMNEVAQKCRDKGLMNYVGDSCVPREVSLLEALLANDEDRFRRLQARDGYASSLNATRDRVDLRPLPGQKTLRGLIRSLPLFEALSDDEIAVLSEAAEVRRCMPTECIVKEGDSGNSLFIVEWGHLTIEVERDGKTQKLRRQSAGDFLGEMALLTGEPRSASVICEDYATLIELKAHHLRPVIEARPSLLETMSETASARQHSQSRQMRNVDAGRKAQLRRMRGFLLQRSTAKAAAQRESKLTSEEVARHLRKIKLFAPLTDSELEGLAPQALARRYGTEQSIVRQGDRTTALYVIVEGSAVASRREKGQRKILGTMVDGEVFGEMALLTGERRSADVTSGNKGCLVVEITRSDFAPLMTHRPPLMVELSTILSSRKGGSVVPLDAKALKRRMWRLFFG